MPLALRRTRSRTPDCVLDGEICALDEEGRSSFSLDAARAAGRVVLVLFDVLEVDGGRRSSTCRCAERREQLEELLDRRNEVVRLADVRRRRRAARGRSRRRSSRASSPSGPTRRTSRDGARRDWLKIKMRQTQEFVIAGYTSGQGRRAGGFGALVARRSRRGCAALGRQRRHGLHGRRDRAAAGDCCGRSSARTRPFADVPKMPRVRKVGRHLGRAEARRRGRVRRVDARRPAARARPTWGCARTRPRARCDASVSRSRRC